MPHSHSAVRAAQLAARTTGWLDTAKEWHTNRHSAVDLSDANCPLLAPVRRWWRGRAERQSPGTAAEYGSAVT